MLRGIETSCVSKCQPLGNSGRIGRSIMRAVSVPFSPLRPSRLKNEPGILPAAYIRSSTSTVSGRKSTSRRFPTVAVLRTMVSPCWTTTAPEACLAILPVSKVISLPAISTETRVTEPSLICVPTFCAHPSVGGLSLASLIESERRHPSARVQHAIHHKRRRFHDSRPQSLPDVALHALGHRVRPPVGLEALDVEPEPLGALPEVGVGEPALVGIERVV